MRITSRVYFCVVLLPDPLIITIFQGMKKILTVILAISLCTACFAADIEEVIAAAYQNSSKVTQYERSRQDSLLNNSVSDSTWSYSVEVPKSTIYDDEGTHYPSAVISSSINNSKNDLQLSTGLTVSRSELLSREGSDYHSLSGQIKVSKTFDFTDWSSNDYSREIRNITVEQTYQSSVLNFRKSVLSDVYSIIDAKLSIEKAERSLNDSKDSYNTKITTGQLVEGSTTQISEKMKIDSSISSLNSQKTVLENKLKAFEKNYGIAYTDVDSATRPVLEFEADSENSMTVYLAKLNYLYAQQALYEKTGKGNSITLSANADPTLNFRTDSGYDSASLSLGTGIDYVGGNLKVGIGVTESYSSKGWGTPVVKVSGSYTGGNKNTKEVNDLETAVMTKQLAYDTALYNYETSANGILDNIQTALVAYDQLEIQKDYHNKILEYTKTLYENGFVTEKEYDSAKFDVRIDQVQELLLNLKAMQLETEIQLLSL